MLYILNFTLEFQEVVPGRLGLPTSTLSVWRSNQLSYRTVITPGADRRETGTKPGRMPADGAGGRISINRRSTEERGKNQEPASFYTDKCLTGLQKGGVPAAPSGTATLLRLSPNHRFHPRPTLAVTDFRRPRLSWLDGRCVQGPGTYSPRHG